MATIQKNISKKTGEVINWKWTALLGRDESGKQIRIAKRVEPLEGMTPAKERDKMQRLADEWEEQERAEYIKIKGRENDGKAQARKEKDKITLADFIDKRWMPNHVKKGVKPHTPDTIAFYTNMSNDIKAYFKPNLKLSQIDKEDVLAYLAYMRNDAKTKRGTPYGATTIQHHFSTLRNILNYAVYIEYIKENPCMKVRPDDRPQRDHKDIDFLDTEDSIKFLTCLESDQEKEYWNGNHRNPLMWQSMVNILITTGLRRGELVGLQWGDIDRKNMMLNIQRNVTIDTTNKDEIVKRDEYEKEEDYERAKYMTKIHVGELKGRGKDETRKVPVSKYVLGLLDLYKADQEEKYGAAILPHAYIFCRDNNPYLPMYPTEPTRMMAKYIKRHKLPNMSPHDLRHTAGYLAIESGSSVKEIQALLGHKDPALSLKFYVGITEKAQQKTVEGIESLLRPKAAEKKA
jgi:integrase